MEARYWNECNVESDAHLTWSLQPSYWSASAVVASAQLISLQSETGGCGSQLPAIALHWASMMHHILLTRYCYILQYNNELILSEREKIRAWYSKMTGYGCKFVMHFPFEGSFQNCIQIFPNFAWLAGSTVDIEIRLLGSSHAYAFHEELSRKCKRTWYVHSTTNLDPLFIPYTSSLTHTDIYVGRLAWNGCDDEQSWANVGRKWPDPNVNKLLIVP